MIRVVLLSWLRPGDKDTSRTRRQNTLSIQQVHYQGETKDFHPEEISSMVLAKMKETAEAYLGSTVKVGRGGVFCKKRCLLAASRRGSADVSRNRVLV